MPILLEKGMNFVSISNVSQDNSIKKCSIEQINNLSTEEKNQLISIFDAIDEQEEDNQSGTITTDQAINNFLAKTKDYLGEKYNEFLNFLINNHSDKPQIFPQPELTRSEQYEKLTLSLNIEGKIRGQKHKELINSGYVDAHGNVTVTQNNFQEEGVYIPTEQDLANMKYVFGQTSFADNFSDHNQMIDAIEYAKSNGVDISEVTTLISCDTHSDVYMDLGRESIADWVNTVLARNPNITDFYWVVSDNMVKDDELGNILSGNTNLEDWGGPIFQNVYIKKDLQEGMSFQTVKANLQEGESVQTYYVSSDGFLTPDNWQGNGRPVKIHITTERFLPDFSGQQVISTFDMDYFSNSGVDTITLYRDNKNEEELNQAFAQILQTFADHHIQPIIHGNCYSNDDYLPQEDYNQAQGFANEIIKSTPQGSDIFEQYKHKHKHK